MGMRTVSTESEIRTSAPLRTRGQRPTSPPKKEERLVESATQSPNEIGGTRLEHLAVG